LAISSLPEACFFSLPTQPNAFPFLHSGCPSSVTVTNRLWAKELEYKGGGETEGEGGEEDRQERHTLNFHC